MTAPHRQKKKIVKSTSSMPSSSPTSVSAMMDEIVKADSWHDIVDILCVRFKLPDLTTRGGLKKVHGNFEAIYKRIDSVYQAEKDNERLACGIMGLYTKMCTDAMLRDKLLAKGLIEKILPLLSNPETVQFMSLSMSIITHHGGAGARLAIAAHTPFLTSVISDNINDSRVVGNLVAAISHALGALLFQIEIEQKQLFKKLSPHFPILVETMLKVFCAPSATKQAIDHAMVLFSSLPQHCHALCKQHPAVIDFLIAGLRSTDIVNRSVCVGAVVRYHFHEAEEESRHFDPHLMLNKFKQQKTPKHLSDLSMDYGPPRCEIYLTLQSSVENMKAFMRCAQDRDLYQLGLTLVQCIWQTEFSVSQGGFGSDSTDVNGNPIAVDVGLPFKMWHDSLPHCAAAIRARKFPEAYEDMADMLEIKYLLVTSRPDDAVEYARRSCARNPHCAYFYYGMSLSGNPEIGLRAAKKGMKCTNGSSAKKKTSPFVRFQMMQRAVEHAGWMGLSLLQDPPPQEELEKAWEQGIAFLMSALEDARVYVKDSPPDNRHRKNVLYWAILLTFLLDGPKVSSDMREIKPLLKQLSYADDFTNYFSVRPSRTTLRLAQQTIISRYEDACKDGGMYGSYSIPCLKKKTRTMRMRTIALRRKSRRISDLLKKRLPTS